MKHYFFFLILIISFNSFGQFAIVNDNDSLLNVREDGSVSSKIVDKLPNGFLIFCFEKKGNWTNIDYTKKDKELHGYIYSKNYKLVSSFLTIPLLQTKDNVVILKKDTIQVKIFQSQFDKSKHKFKFLKDYPNQIELIDNKKYYGEDGGVPKTQFEKVEIKIGQKNIILPKIALEGLYNPNLFNAQVNYDITNDIFYIQTMNSDGAGSYEVIWKIEKGVYKNRLVAYGF